MAATHDVHRFIEDNLFGPFQRTTPQPSSYRSMTASDMLSQRSSVSASRLSSFPQQYKCRPSSDILQVKTKPANSSPEAEAIDRWFENIQKYEQMLEEVAAASLDQGFKDELNQINQWFQCRSDAERTAAFYTVVQNASQIQIRFLITVLQQLANGGEPYPAGQENESEVQSYYHPSTKKNNLYAPNTFNTSQSVISTESEYEVRKRLAAKTTPIGTKKVACMSEPDDLIRRRNRDLFVSRPLGLSHPGPLYEKALAARAQLHALNNNDTSLFSCNSSILSSSNSSSTSSSSSNSLQQTTNNPHGSTGGLFSSPPHARLRTSLSTTDLKTPPLFNNNNNNHSDTKDWPFPPSPSLYNDDSKTSWSFGSLRSKKLPWSIKEEEQENYSKLSATIQSSLNTLEQAQARLKKDLPSTTNVYYSPPPSATVLLINNQDDEHSDTSSNKEKPLTGLARRRKRSSAARALKDKIAAETVDFDLMQDVQNWLRSLRLHKYGHAFIGLDWKQVIRMSDEDMEVAGVNTIGARRKLLKVFENVQRHCKENDIDF